MITADDDSDLLDALDLDASGIWDAGSVGIDAG
jgi:hypothetical protein